MAPRQQRQRLAAFFSHSVSTRDICEGRPENVLDVHVYIAYGADYNVLRAVRILFVLQNQNVHPHRSTCTMPRVRIAVSDSELGFSVPV